MTETRRERSQRVSGCRVEAIKTFARVKLGASHGVEKAKWANWSNEKKKEIKKKEEELSRGRRE